MKKIIKKKILIAFCLCLIIGMTPVSSYGDTNVPGASGHVLENMAVATFSGGYDSTIIVYVTPGVSDYMKYSVDDNIGVFHIPEHDSSKWYFDGWKTWYKGSWSGLGVTTTNKENPKYDDNTNYFTVKQKGFWFGNEHFPAGTMEVLKEDMWKGTYYLSAVFKPVLTVNAGDGVTYSVSGASKVSDGKYALTYGGSATVTYAVDAAYEVTNVGCSYGIDYTESGGTVTIKDYTRPGSVSINTQLKHQHDYGEGWFYDGEQHWHECSCGEQADAAEHSGGIATCEKTALCEECAQPYGDVDSGNHAGGTELRNAVDATATEKGYTGDTYCLGCGGLISEGQEIPSIGTGGVGGPIGPIVPDEPDEPIIPGGEGDQTEPDEPIIPGGEGDQTEPDGPIIPDEGTDLTGPANPEDPAKPIIKDQSAASNDKVKQAETKDITPQTGDADNSIYWILLLAGMIVMAVIAVPSRKQKV